MKSMLTRRQVKELPIKHYAEDRQKYRIAVKIRYDDECGNGHNSFAITATIDRQAKNNRWVDYMGGCCHDKVVKHFPHLAPYIKWHLCSSGKPMHYLANTIYHVEQGELAHARSSAIWPDATDTDLLSPGLKERLDARLPQLLLEFQKAVESLGFVF